MTIDGAKVPKRLLMTALIIGLVLQLIPVNILAQTIPKPFILSGHIRHLNGYKIFFSYKGLGNDRIWDSTTIKGDNFIFKGQLSQPSKALLTLPTNNRRSTTDPNVTMPMFIEPGSMHITLRKDHFREGKLTGSVTQQEYMQLLSAEKHSDELLTLQQQRNNLEELFNKKNIAGSDTLAKLIESISDLNTRIQSLNRSIMVSDREFFRQHPSSYITVFKIVDDIRHYDFQELESFYNKMSYKVQHSEYGVQLLSAINNVKKGSTGTIAADFTAEGIDGDPIQLKKYKGKYVCLDFWASWCKPCRAGNPSLRKLFQRYRKELVFIGLASVDKSIVQWKSAVTIDSINIWPQGLAGKIGDLYHVQGLPTIILIDPQGMIIGRYSEEDGEPEENLPKKLNQLFNKAN